jgi:hypothetical protein
MYKYDLLQSLERQLPRINEVAEVKKKVLDIRNDSMQSVFDRVELKNA